jgi:hypothetical protein
MARVGKQSRKENLQMIRGKRLLAAASLPELIKNQGRSLISGIIR